MGNTKQIEQEIRGLASYLAETTKSLNLIDKTRFKKQIEGIISRLREIESKV